YVYKQSSEYPEVGVDSKCGEVIPTTNVVSTTNTIERTVTHAVIHVIFKDSMCYVAQTEDVPLHVLQTSGPYPDAVDLSVSPLAPGQSKQFRLTFESVSAQWNHEFPELQITDLTTK